MNTDTNSHWDKLCILGLIVILALAVVLVASSTASINDGGENVSATAIGDYDYNLGGQTATLIGYSSEGSHPADIVIPDAVEYPAGSGTTYKVTVIGLGAFANDSSVNSITIGNNVEYIDDRVCAQCTNLKGTLIIPNSVVNIDSDAFAYTALTELVIGEKASYIKTSAFSHCNNLTKITYNTTNIAEYPLFYHLGAETGLEVIFGDNVTNIPNQMLSSNTKLKTLTIGTGVKSMGAQAFAMCTNLTKVNYNATDITSFFASAFEQSGADGLEVIFGDNVEIIPANIFSGNKKLSSLTIGTNVNGIGNIAFAECSNLTSITYNATNANVYESAFNGAGGKGLEVTFGDEVTNIPERIFQECRNMATLTIGKNVANIGNYAFTSCMGVTSISYNAINATLGKEPFANIGKESENLVVTFGDEVTNIPAKIFQGCSNLTTLTIGESVVDIGEDAFTGCKLVTLNFNGKNIGKGLFSKQTELKTLCLGDNVETIGEEAFLNCEKMTTLTIGEGATSIDSSAFNGCSSLTTIVFKAAVVPENLFGEINSITELTLGDKVTTIGASAFKNAKIETLVIPESVTKIEQEAFANCVHLTSIEFNAAEITDFGGEVFANAGAEAESLEVVFGDKVTVIPEGIFRENTKIAKLTIGENVNTIGGEAFAECTGIKTIEFYAPTIPMELFANSTGLEKLVIGEKVTIIRDAAFAGCIHLTSIDFNAVSVTEFGGEVFVNAGAKSDSLEVVFGDEVTVIPEGIFAENSNITKITLGSALTTIEARAFAECSGINAITIPESVTIIRNEAFANCVNLTSIEFNAVSVTEFGSEVFVNAGAKSDSLEVVFGDEVTVIPEGIFRENTKIVKLTIGEKVEMIGEVAFAGCTGIKTIEFYAPTIPGKLFASSTGLENLVIGKKVTIIGNAAFANCVNLTSIDFNAVAVTEFGSEVFVNAGAKAESLEVVFGDEVTVIPEGIFAENSNITKITLGSALTTIEARAFAECSGINAITIPESVTKIEEGAFANCVNLTSIEFNAVSVTEFGGGVFDGAGAEAKSLEVVFGNNVTVIPREMFTGNSKITKLIIGEKVEMIGEVAFAGCTGIKTIEFYAPTIPGELFASSTGLENLVIGKKVTIIGNAAFAGCIHLTSIEFNAVSVTAFGSGVFDGAGAEAKSLEVVFGNNVTVIPREMFTGNSKITKLIIGEKVETIGEVAFAECSGLTTINFNAINIKDDKIGNDVFSGAGSDEGLVVVFGEKVTHIPRAIFAGNEKMTELTIGENVTSIGDEAFRGCSKLATIQYNATQISTGENAFSETGAEGLEIIFGDNVTKICDNAFMNCTGLTSITISNSITTIGNCAFMNCTNLSSVNFGSGVESIGDEAFRNCAIISLVIPANVKNINTMSFYDNSALNDVTITEGTLTFGNLAFGQCPNIKNAVFGTFGDNVSVGENVFSYGTESDVVTQYIFKNVGISDDFIFTEETVKKGIFNDRVYEFKQQGILVNHAVITFDPKEGSCPVESLNTDETGKITETLPVATRDGYIFIGWYDGETKISQDTVFTKNTTVEAKWNAQYTITFDANGGECSVKTMKTNAEGKIDGTIPTPTRERYTFEGWYLNGEKISEETVFTKDTTVKAEWKYIPYVITFDPKGGECIVKTMYTKEDGKIDGTIPTPTREGFLFEGWYDGEIQISKDTVFTKDTTVEAKWSSNACTVTFDPDNGEDVFTITTEKGKKIEEPTVSRKGYTFIGWFDSNDTLWIFDNDVFNEDTSLKAKWMEIKAEIETTTDSNGNAEVVIPAGTDVETVEIVDENMTITITGETAKKIVGNRLIISIRPINAEFAYELIMKLNDEDFYGEITVSIPFDSELTEEPTVYIRENGKDTLIESVFDTENNTIYFEANHGSIYVVKYTEEPDPEPVPVPAKGDDFNWLLLVLFLATVLSVTFVGAARKD